MFSNMNNSASQGGRAPMQPGMQLQQQALAPFLCQCGSAVKTETLIEHISSCALMY